ncbi:cell wall metabolism sensor histidine kinase WalK [Williamsia sp. CHRR-6]|uniref:sensor histidine kinase n=1 Tax=Williamsia sp. CHRR-6 TaxID=2835871 RepID=UPI001BDAB1FD|nr:ATP-binding protein [Williamsia sp. CHRR-6]MBT0565996.1 sensor histidine kinase [Williamsia sp. CHRR-6]
MTVAIGPGVVLLIGVASLIGVAAWVGWRLGRRSGEATASALTRLHAATSSPAPAGDEVGADLRPHELLEPGAEAVHGRMSKAALLALIMQSDDTGIAVVDEHRDVVLYNRRADELGLVHARLLNDQVWEAAQTVLRTGTDADLELAPERSVSGFVSTGRAVDHAVAVRVWIRLVGDGTERYAVAFGDDDSDTVRLEATRRDFVANVSHELKTPVGAIGLLTEALLESHDDPESVRHFGERVITEANRMGNMVNELIALSRLQGAEKLPDTEDVDVDDLLDDAIHRAQVGAEAAGITLTTDPPTGLVVRGDRTLLLTALNNLIANAIAYSPANSPVSVSRRVVAELVPGSDTTRQMVAIAVTDRGIGIAPRDQERVFERFFRVDKARSRATGGTGLGLAIVKHVAANHDGSIRLWSKPGTGSTFTLSIPRSLGSGTATGSADGRAVDQRAATPAAETSGRIRPVTMRPNPDRRVLETKEINR